MTGNECSQRDDGRGLSAVEFLSLGPVEEVRNGGRKECKCGVDEDLTSDFSGFQWDFSLEVGWRMTDAHRPIRPGNGLM